MHFRPHIVRQGGEISNKMQPWHSQANYDLKKYSYVTCRGELTPSKFDTYSYQVKSMFGCEADLNTLTARQLKSIFCTKRLTHEKVWDNPLSLQQLDGFLRELLIFQGVCSIMFWEIFSADMWLACKLEIIILKFFYDVSEVELQRKNGL
jgi:hypothetical protein